MNISRVALALMAVMICSTVFAADPLVPPADQILSTLRPGHPRVLVTADDFQRLRQQVKTDQTLRQWHAALREEATEILAAPPSQYEIPDGKRLLATSRQVMGRIYTLAMLYQLDGDRRYLDRAWTELNTAANFKDWNPSHFLDTAEMTHAFAIGYDWLYDAWSPQQRKTLRDAMVRHGLTPGLRSYRGEESYGRWTKARHNWNQVCNGGLAMGALAVADEEPALAAEILTSGLESLKLAMHEFAPDGAWAEGPGYWAYATRYTVPYLAALTSALGSDFGYSEYPGFAQTGDFAIYITSPTRHTFNFADGSDSPLKAPHMFWLARRFKNPYYAAFALKHAEPDARDLLWYTPPPAELDELFTEKYFRGAEVVTMRSEWNNPDAIFIGFKAGDNKVNHSHLDLGSFVLDAMGVRWAVDLGKENYNLPAFFGDKRWTYFRNRAESHNTLLINPANGADQDPRAETEIVTFEERPCCAWTIADLTAAYAEHARSVKRGVGLMEDREQVVIQDEISLKEPGEVYWLMHTAADIRISPDGRTAELSHDGQRLIARLREPGSARFTVAPAGPLPSSPNPPNQTPNGYYQRLTVHLKNVQDVRLVVNLTPITRKESATLAMPKLLPLSDW